MSDLSNLLKRRITVQDFIVKNVKRIRKIVGSERVDEILEDASEEIQKVKDEVEEILDRYLKDKLPGDIGPIVQSIADTALNSLSIALSAALLDLKNAKDK